MNGRDRREFLKVLGAGAVAAGVPPWTYARTVYPDQEPTPPVRDPRYREWSGVALAEAKRLGCSYADIRFTRNRSQSLTLRNGQIFTGGGRFGGDGFGGRGGGGTVETYGFGIRVIHGGVWGFASSPVVTPEEIKRVAAIATDIATASAIAKKFDVRLAPVEKYDDYWQMPFENDPWTVPLEEKVELLRGVTSGDSEDAWRSLRDRDGRVRVRVEVPRHQRRLVHRTAVPLLQLQRGGNRTDRHAGQDAQLTNRRRAAATSS